MSIFATNRYALSLSAAAALLAGCGALPLSLSKGQDDTRPPLSSPAAGLAPQQSLTSRAYNRLHEFGNSAGDGTNPYAGLIVVKGTLYGTTFSGGSNNSGTVFAVTKTGEETVLHSFGASGDGSGPAARLLDVNGTLYGTTTVGGANNSGTVFSITPGGKEKVLYSFPYSGNGGALPFAGLIDVNGTLYGTTYQGGTCRTGGCGTVFSITTSGTEHLLYSFGKRPNDGEYPQAALLDVGGTLYGTTLQGGKYRRGTVFTISTAGKEHVLYSFGASANDGTEPSCTLIYVKGALYGTTQHGPGPRSSGTVFSITKFGRANLVYGFNGSDGSQPIAGLVDVKGVLYGTTLVGGVKNVGAVFSVATSGEEEVLHSFRAQGGKHPYAGLVEAGGTLYGTTYGAVNGHHGTVFSLTP
ncbi:MAG TPA: choice-of-anchor tandem repeat GloVer-containing protein [Candidatus Cybelea sp.]|nr:choice-of-anchor tandem repeat GloVer-containing protein [Candidatus Cybelea sp.]